MILIGKDKIAYCEICGNDVKLKRKNFEHMYHELICIMFLTVVLIPVYIFLRLKKKKNTCPNCETEFDLNNLPINPNK